MKRYLLVYGIDCYKIITDEEIFFVSINEPMIPLAIIELTDNLIKEIIGVKDETPGNNRCRFN